MVGFGGASLNEHKENAGDPKTQTLSELVRVCLMIPS